VALRELTHEERMIYRIVEALRSTPFFHFRNDFRKPGFDITLEELAVILEDNRDFQRDHVSPKVRSEQEELQEWRRLGQALAVLYKTIQTAPKKPKGENALIDGLAFLTRQVEERLKQEVPHSAL